MQIQPMTDRIRMPAVEGPYTAFQATWTDEAEESINAFLNSGGGRVFFGLAEDGTVVGLEDPDSVERSIRSSLRFAIRPDAGNFCRVLREEVDGKVVVIADVLEGSRRPYFVSAERTEKASCGTPERCFVRCGSSNCEAGEVELKALIRKSDPAPQELRPSPEQDLTYEALSQCFAAGDFGFSERNFKALGITNASGFFTNLGFWVSDQSTVETRVGFFSGADKASEVEDIVSFRGSVAEQYFRILELLTGRGGSSCDAHAREARRGLLRHAAKDYPEAALREALVNLFTLRDDGIRAASTISCFSDRIEFLSLGGLLPDADPALFRLGASMARHSKLEAMLLKLSGLHEFAIGTPLVYESYRACGLEPKVAAYSRATMIVLPKMTHHCRRRLSIAECEVVDFLRRHGASKRCEIQNALKKSYGFTITMLKSLTEAGWLLREVSGRLTRYRVR